VNLAILVTRGKLASTGKLANTKKVAYTVNPDQANSGKTNLNDNKGRRRKFGTRNRAAKRRSRGKRDVEWWGTTNKKRTTAGRKAPESERHRRIHNSEKKTCKAGRNARWNAGDKGAVIGPTRRRNGARDRFMREGRNGSLDTARLPRRRSIASGGNEGSLRCRRCN
jgi:hypothetical protein